MAIADACHRRYLEPRGALLHGDVQPGNVLLAVRGPCLLDAEIAHVGDPAFDVGTLLGHVVLAGLARGRSGAALAPAERLWSAYEAGRSDPPLFSEVARYAGLEMMRRTVGAARVALVERDEAALAVLAAAVDMIRKPPDRPQALAS